MGQQRVKQKQSRAETEEERAARHAQAVSDARERYTEGGLVPLTTAAIGELERRAVEASGRGLKLITFDVDVIVDVPDEPAKTPAPVTTTSTPTA